jgi:hypothetical protein
VFRRQANQIFTSFGDGVELYTATLDPLSRNVISSIHLRDFSRDGKDSIYWAEDRYEYSSRGFLQKQMVKFNNAFKLGELRYAAKGDNVWMINNDGKNVTKKIYLINQTDSIFRLKNGALFSSQTTTQRMTFTYTHSVDEVLVLDAYPYQIGKQDLNLISSETFIVEESKDNGATWQLIPYRTVNRTFIHEISDGLLKKTTVKVPGEIDEIRNYFYIKR